MNLFLSPSGIKHSVIQKQSLAKLNFCSLFKPKKESMSLVRLRMDLAERVRPVHRPQETLLGVKKEAFFGQWPDCTFAENKHKV